MNVRGRLSAAPNTLNVMRPGLSHGEELRAEGAGTLNGESVDLTASSKSIQMT
jgi:hypothetical protein